MRQDLSATFSGPSKSALMEVTRQYQVTPMIIQWSEVTFCLRHLHIKTTSIRLMLRVHRWSSVLNLCLRIKFRSTIAPPTKLELRLHTCFLQNLYHAAPRNCTTPLSFTFIEPRLDLYKSQMSFKEEVFLWPLKTKIPFARKVFFLVLVSCSWETKLANDTDIDITPSTLGLQDAYLFRDRSEGNHIPTGRQRS